MGIVVSFFEYNHMVCGSYGEVEEKPIQTGG